MKTLVFCTAYAAAPTVWETRYRRWLGAVTGPGLGADQVLMVDDGSATLPGWPGLRVESGDDLGDAARVGRHGGPLLFHFIQHMGRAAIYDFPGWHRSFAFGALYAEANGFDRVIHLESDAFLISERAQAYFRDFRDGWAALWCARYNFPEIAFQVVAGVQLRALADFARQPYDRLRHEVHELALPLTHVERGLTGERYGEDYDQVPAAADYAGQVQSFREPSYYWWLEGGVPNEAEPLIDWRFGADGNLSAPLGDGWSGPEAGHRWMVGVQSLLALPMLPPGQDFVLLMTVMPHVRRGKLNVQRMIVYFNETKIGDFDLTGTDRVGCPVPATCVRQDGANRLRLLHPDAMAPSALQDHQDGRRLALGLIRLQIFPVAAAGRPGEAEAGR
jgi:hypothetical protein